MSEAKAKKKKGFLNSLSRKITTIFTNEEKKLEVEHFELVYFFIGALVKVGCD